MGRPPKHDADRLLDAAAELLAAGGPAAVTMSAVAKAVGAPSGSVYHRFPDRPALLAALWNRTLSRFRDELLAVLTLEPPEEAIRRGARATLDWARQSPREAAVLLAGARELGERDWSEAARADTARANAAIQDALTELIARTGDAGARATDRVLLAVVDLPYALVRRYLRGGQEIPAHAADLAEQAAAALLGAPD
ncbi:TetR/AcrR family transcriptional regulator [Nocardia bhagyanarayanae]|uniref:TetR family transcriptional regulator n=1 Tax=Nocardia bhagyanarayanae TaxID=1215925 RepID=A0A543FBH8_9NOCA|nr:TetR/AcrR family transcriptional regulator [Nocardia bhagyanarayanae]TQM31154.1 TetR family transcriptional regulator [Nocardia bhagyanarayanae]